MADESGAPKITDAATPTPTEEPKAAATPAPEPVKPSEYQPFKLPEGLQVNEALLGEFSSFALAKGYSQEDAQGLVDLYAKAAAAREQEHAALIDQWAEETAKDKELGGADLKAKVTVARTALERFGTPALRDLLESSGLGNHPEVVRAFWKIGTAIAEDRIAGSVPQGAAASKPRSLYDTVDIPGPAAS